MRPTWRILESRLEKLGIFLCCLPVPRLVPSPFPVVIIVVIFLSGPQFLIERLGAGGGDTGMAQSVVFAMKALGLKFSYLGPM